MKTTNFKPGDTVYHWYYGEGGITIITPSDDYPVCVRFEKKHGDVRFTMDGREFMQDPPTLSLTPYDFVKGGFSQNRPLEKNDPIFVRIIGQPWHLRFFSHFDGDKVVTFERQLKSAQTNLLEYWPEYSVDNPLIIKKDESIQNCGHNS